MMKLKLWGIIAFVMVIGLLIITCGENGNPSSPQTKYFTVTFNSNGGSDVNPQTINEGGKVTEPQGVKKDGHTIDGWYNESTLKNKWNFTADTVTENITLYAKWNENPPDTFTVTFNSNGGSDVNPQTINEGGKVTEPQGVTKNRYIIDGWYNGETQWNFSVNTITDNLTLHAKWNLNSSLIATDFDGQAVDHIFEVHNIVEWNTAIEAIQTGGSSKNYLINVNDSFAISPSDYQSITFGVVSEITVAIWGDMDLSLLSTGTILYIGGSHEFNALHQTIILRDIVLRGRTDNTSQLVNVSYFGKLIMKGNATITGNTATGTIAQAGVNVSGGTFIMEGGTISNNTVIADTVGFGGGDPGVSLAVVTANATGVPQSYSPIFIKTGGTIYGSDPDDPLSNIVKNLDGTIRGTRGALRLNTPSTSRDKTILPDQILEFDGSIWVKWVDDDGIVTNL